MASSAMSMAIEPVNQVIVPGMKHLIILLGLPL
jgi:hypothetical protein